MDKVGNTPHIYQTSMPQMGTKVICKNKVSHKYQELSIKYKY